MKRILYLIMILTLASCSTCMLGQIPPQFLYVDESCGAAMPDYLSKIRVTDNCEVDTVWQSPTRGTWLTQPANNAMIRAIDKFGNFTDVLFTVNLVDTVPPVIEVTDSTLISDVYNKIDAVYNIADRMLARTDLWNSTQIPDSIPVYEDYWNNTLVAWTDPGHAFTGEGMRVWTFAQPGDTLIIR